MREAALYSCTNQNASRVVYTFGDSIGERVTVMSSRAERAQGGSRLSSLF